MAFDIIFKEFPSPIICGNCGYSNKGKIVEGYSAVVDDDGKRAILTPFSIACLDCDGLISRINFDTPLDINGGEKEPV